MIKAPLVLAFLLLYGPCGMAANPSVNCEDGAGSMAEVRACLHEQNVASVKAAYAALSVKIKARMPQASDELEAAQRSWVQYARDSCDFLGEFNAGTMIREDARANCWADFVRARVKLLRSWELQLEKRP
jgi:uncharacterized protein YecT (DUF1311 family)